MLVEILTPTLAGIGGVIGTLGLFSIFPKIITNSLSEVHQNKNRKLLEDIKKENQILLADIQAKHTVKLEEMKKGYQKEIEGYKIGLQTVARYSEYQFKLYNELWTSLYELKSKAEELWEHASTRNLTEFASQLRDTKKIIEQNILLINEEHYNALIRIIKTFETYKIGKRNLISIRNSYRNRERVNDIDNVGDNELDFIEINRQVKNEYITLVGLLATEFKKHISEPVT